MRESSAQMGLMLQSCPFCGEPGDFSEDECLHITCRKCNEQYCFLCAASHTPIVEHANTCFHRPQCSFFEAKCCDAQCMTKGAALCSQVQFLPGPCAACKNKASLHNSCKHVQGSAWKACSICLERKKNCLHWCHECSRGGKQCSRPGELSATELAKNCHIIPHSAALAEEARRKSERKSP